MFLSNESSSISPLNSKKSFAVFVACCTIVLIECAETKYLDRMGVDIPEAALNVALQEKTYYNLVERLNAMLSYVLNAFLFVTHAAHAL